MGGKKEKEKKDAPEGGEVSIVLLRARGTGRMTTRTITASEGLKRGEREASPHLIKLKWSPTIVRLSHGTPTLPYS